MHIKQYVDVLSGLNCLFVCLFFLIRSVNSKSLTDLLCQLEKEDIPVLVCITHGDYLYADICKELRSGSEEEPTTEKIKHRLELELKVIYCFYGVSFRRPV